jgi:hypothetical protein
MPSEAQSAFRRLGASTLRPSGALRVPCYVRAIAPHPCRPWRPTTAVTSSRHHVLPGPVWVRLSAHLDQDLEDASHRLLQPTLRTTSTRETARFPGARRERAHARDTQGSSSASRVLPCGDEPPCDDSPPVGGRFDDARPASVHRSPALVSPGSEGGLLRGASPTRRYQPRAQPAMNL